MTDKQREEYAKKIAALLQKQANLQREVTESFDGYMKGLERLKDIQEEHNHLLKEQERISKELLNTANLTTEEVEKLNVELEVVNKALEKTAESGERLAKAIKSVDKTKLFGGKAAAESIKAIGKGFDLIGQGLGKIRGYGLFKMDKAMKESALSMGVLSKQTTSFNNSLSAAALKSNSLGFTIEDAAQAQAVYSEELGRTVMLGEQGLVAIGQMAKATGLGAEGAAKMAAEFENQGISAERTAEFMEKTMNNAHKLGLNASKVVKLIQANMKMLNKYHFKDGVKGLEKMAKLVSKLGVDMEFASGFADKLWDVEGAVEMSAQLQVMGGQWSQLADPFALMYKARNDVAGLTEEIANAAAASAKWNATTGEFDLSAKEMHRLKIIADQTGLSYDELAKAGKNAAKFAKIKGQATFDFGTGEEGKAMEEFITNTSKLDEQGRAYIEVGVKGEKKFLNQLTNSDKSLLKSQILEKQTMKERAEQATTFDEQLDYLVNQLKVLALPLVKSLNTLIPKIANFTDSLGKKGGIGDKIVGAFEKAGEVIKWFGELIIDHPLASALTYFGAKIAPMIINSFLETKKWFEMGKIMAMGFQSAMPHIPGSSSPWQPGQTGPSGGGGRFVRGANMLGKGLLAGNALDLGIDAYQNIQDENVNGWDKLLKTLDENKGKIALGVIGGILAPFTGGLSVAAAAGIGATIGSVADEAMPTIGNYGVHDGFFGSPVHDGAFGKGDFSKKRGVLQGGKITPIDNKDDLLAMKSDGGIGKFFNDLFTSNGTNNETTKVDFSDLNVNGRIMVELQGAPGLAEDLMKVPSFRRDLSIVIQSELEKNRNYGKNRG